MHPGADAVPFMQGKFEDIEERIDVENGEYDDGRGGKRKILDIILYLKNRKTFYLKFWHHKTKYKRLIPRFKKIAILGPEKRGIIPRFSKNRYCGFNEARDKWII
jgi:hypothetical protein